MKTRNAYKFIGVALVAFLVAPFFASADYTTNPSASIVGAANITTSSVEVTVSYNAGNGYTELDQAPTVYVQYTNLTTGEVAISNYVNEFMNSQTTTFEIDNLVPNTKYSYRAVVQYEGNKYGSDPQTFTTLSDTSTVIQNTASQNQGIQYVTPTTISDGGTNTLPASSNNGSIATSTSQTTQSAGLLSRVATGVTNIVATGGYIKKNGIVMGFTDLQANVREGDMVTYTIQYSNTNTLTALHNAQIVVTLPEQYEYVSGTGTSDALYSPSMNTVSFYLGTVPALGIGEKTFSVRATGAGDGEIQSIATLSYDGGSLSTNDRDSYSGNMNSRSVLGASVFGAGFFPQTFVGWAVIILLITFIIIVARRYRKTTQVAVAK